jgi:crotonobetainyl-CoA:carnitine CoA-transferase CaiB-like acyl-CoA transferase
VWTAILIAGWWLEEGTEKSFDVSMAELVASKLNDARLDGEQCFSGRDDQVLVRFDDGYLALAAPTGHRHEMVLTALDIGIDDGRVERDAGILVVDMRGSGRARDEVLHQASERGITGYLAKGAAELVIDPQLRGRGFIVELEHPAVGVSPVFALPWKIANEPRAGYRRAPLLGEDDNWAEAIVSNASRPERVSS